MARPSAPTIGTGTDTVSGLVSVTFTASNLGPSATSFTLTSSSGLTSSGASSPLTIQELAEGTYTYTVRGTNANGNGPSSATSNSVVVASVFSPAGNYYSLATISLASNASSILFASIPAGYEHLQIRAYLRDSGATTGYGETQIWVNSGSSYSNPNNTYYRKSLFISDGASAAQERPSNPDPMYGNAYPRGGSYSGMWGVSIIDIYDYTSTTTAKTFKSFGGFDGNGAGQIGLFQGTVNTLDPITQIAIGPNQSGFLAGSRFALYGVK